MDDKLMRIEEVAAALGVSYALAQRMVSDGKIPSVRLGARSVRVRQSDLVKFLATGKWGGSSR